MGLIYSRPSFSCKKYFATGMHVLWDLYGTNHDPRTWSSPERFQPERFENWDESAFNFVPQGGGDHYTTHRCPGEWIATALLKDAANFLSRDISYEVPEQDLELDFSDMPPLPRSRFVMRDVRPAGAAG